jgi:hypothetical protein
MHIKHEPSTTQIGVITNRTSFSFGNRSRSKQRNMELKHDDMLLNDTNNANTTKIRRRTQVFRKGKQLLFY